MIKMQKKLFIILLGLSLQVFSADKILSFQSGEYPNTVLELYTSEGCSSCPPADKWLSTLKNRSELFTKIIPLAFHVDYWDSLGWQDDYAKAEYSRRQRNHRVKNNVRSVYTPGVVKDGKELRQWYKGFPINQTSQKVGILSAKLQNKKISVNFNNLSDKTDVILNVALLGSDIVSHIDSGENEGRALQHNFVVLKHQTYAKNQNKALLSWQVSLPTSHIKVPKYAVAVWISERINQRPVQATGSWL